MSKWKFIRLTVLCLAALAAPLHGSLQGHSWEDQSEEYMDQFPQEQICRRCPRSYQRTPLWDDVGSSSSSYYSQRSALPKWYQDPSEFGSFQDYAPRGRRHPKQHVSPYAVQSLAVPSSSGTLDAFDSGESFKRMDVAPANNNYESAKTFEDDKVFNPMNSLAMGNYQATPRRHSRFYSTQGGVDRSSMESDDQGVFNIPIPRSVPRMEPERRRTDRQMSDRHLEDIVRKAIIAARHQQQEEEALFRSMEGSFAKSMNDNQSSASARKMVHQPSNVFRASDLVYRPEITHNPYNLSPEMSITSMLGLQSPRASEQEDFRLKDDVMIEEVQPVDSSVEGPVVDEDAGSVEEQISIEMPNVSSGEVIVPLTIVASQENVEDFNGKLVEDTNDDALEGDVVLVETIEENNDRGDVTAVNPEAVLTSSGPTGEPVGLLELKEDPDIMDEVENPPTATESSVELAASSTTPCE